MKQNHIGAIVCLLNSIFKKKFADKQYSYIYALQEYEAFVQSF